MHSGKMTNEMGGRRACVAAQWRAKISAAKRRALTGAPHSRQHASNAATLLRHASLSAAWRAYLWRIERERAAAGWRACAAARCKAASSALAAPQKHQLFAALNTMHAAHRTAQKLRMRILLLKRRWRSARSVQTHQATLSRIAGMRVPCRGRNAYFTRTPLRRRHRNAPASPYQHNDKRIGISSAATSALCGQNKQRLAQQQT